VNVAPYIPKPHTPWQRAAQIDEATAVDRIMAVRKGLAGDGFKIGYHAPILSLLEGIVSRGDERAGRLVREAYRRGARLDAWEEHINLDLWRKVIADADWDVLADTCRSRGPQEVLPWDGISLALSTSVVSDAVAAEPHPPVPVQPREEAHTATAAPWQRLVFTFSKTGSAVFIAHLDLMTVFERAFARAGYSARFTEGYNPKPRLEFANPLSLGLSSREEVAGIDLHDFDSAESFVARLNGSLPEGVRVLHVAPVTDTGAARRRSLMSLYWGADFQVTDPEGQSTVVRLPATGLSIRKTLQAAGAWPSSSAMRISTWAAGEDQRPSGYFDVLCAPPEADSAPPEADSAPPEADPPSDGSSDLI
jgi:hypothetical protein